MWSLDRSYLSDQRLRVAVVGVGGTGSEVVSNLIHLHHGLRAMGFGGLHVTAFDPDSVSPANIVRQRYAASDIGLKKAEVLIHRVNMSCALDWAAETERFAADAGKAAWDLVISCVDTRVARKELHKYAFSSGFNRWKLWLDCGNDRTTGQVILGTPRCERDRLVNHLPCATELHPEIMDTRLPEDDAPSCSAIDALQKQDLCVNKQVATLAIDLLWRLFRDGQIADHGRYFDLEKGSMAAIAVPKTRTRRRPLVKKMRRAA